MGGLVQGGPDQGSCRERVYPGRTSTRHRLNLKRRSQPSRFQSSERLGRRRVSLLLASVHVSGWRLPFGAERQRRHRVRSSSLINGALVDVDGIGHAMSVALRLQLAVVFLLHAVDLPKIVEHDFGKCFDVVHEQLREHQLGDPIPGLRLTLIEPLVSGHKHEEGNSPNNGKREDPRKHQDKLVDLEPHACPERDHWLDIVLILLQEAEVDLVLGWEEAVRCTTDRVGHGHFRRPAGGLPGHLSRLPRQLATLRDAFRRLRDALRCLARELPRVRAAHRVGAPRDVPARIVVLPLLYLCLGSLSA
mmetsp:Transcript_12332/g.28132  ORF Transcript_12332/g.28132 Transcript_12332/m.28132 type:complete len:305 (-) Transcript_12332:470-1384(-)